MQGTGPLSEEREGMGHLGESLAKQSTEGPSALATDGVDGGDEGLGFKTPTQQDALDDSSLPHAPADVSLEGHHQHPQPEADANQRPSRKRKIYSFDGSVRKTQQTKRAKVSFCWRWWCK